MEFNENIKALYGRMLEKNKRKAVEILSEEAKRDFTYVKQDWLWAKKMPIDWQDRAVEIFQNVLIQQEKETQKTLDKIA